MLLHNCWSSSEKNLLFIWTTLKPQKAFSTCCTLRAYCPYIYSIYCVWNLIVRKKYSPKHISSILRNCTSTLWNGASATNESSTHLEAHDLVKHTVEMACHSNTLLVFKKLLIIKVFEGLYLPTSRGLTILKESNISILLTTSLKTIIYYFK